MAKTASPEERRPRQHAHSAKAGDAHAPGREHDRNDPWPIDGYPEQLQDCRCKPAPTGSPRPPHPEIPINRPKGDDCCRQILQILQCIPGIDQECLKVRKPKTSSKLQVAYMCGALPVKERVAPVLLLILRRLRDGVPAGNAFEKNLRTFLGTLPSDQRTVLDVALNGYDSLPKGRRECVFETRFDSWPDDSPIDPIFLAKNFVGEFMTIGRYLRYGPDVDLFPTMTGPRTWEQSIPAIGEPGKYNKVRAPWPWICAVSPIGHKAIDEKGWWRNESSCVPGGVPRGTINYFTHEYSWICKPASGGGALDCDPVEPSASGGGGFGFAYCSGGEDYRAFDKTTGKWVCLAVPQVDPGAEIGLRGLNFFTRNARVQVSKIDNPPFRPIPDVPLTDWQPDMAAPNGVATCEVQDFAYFNMPTTVRDGLNTIPIPPGRYSLRLIVNNDINFAVEAGEIPPKEFASNSVLIDLQPSPNQRYQILVDEAFCDEETNGLGSDEPWFRAISGAIELPMADTTIQFPPFDRVSIMTAEDVDSGESISFPPASLFNDVIGRKVLGIGVIGLEVDGERAARDQINLFFDAYGLYLNEALVQVGLAASIGGGGLTAIILAFTETAAVSTALWVGGVVAGAILAGGFLYAAWAPADPIAVDALTYSGRQLFDMTDGNSAHIPGESWNRIHQLRMSSESLGKVPAVGGSSVYSERRHYVSAWEDSRYSLTYRFKRI